MMFKSSIPIFFIFFILDLSAYSYSAEQGRLELDPIFISASRGGTPQSHIPDQKDVLTSNDLSNLPVKNLADAMKYLPGVDVQNSGVFGQPSAISIRGSNSSQVLVMVDGIPFNSQLSGQANLSRIPIENVDRIEILKGGSSSAWGSSLGGVVNVITKPAGVTTRPKGSFTTSFGQFSSTKNRLEIEGKKGTIRYYSFGSFLHADGNLADSRTQEGKNFTKIQYDFNDSASAVGSFGYSGAKLRYGPTIDSTVESQHYISRYAQAAFNVAKESQQASITYKYNDQDVSSDSYDSGSWENLTSTISHDFYQGVSLNDLYEFSTDLSLASGIDSDWHQLKSSNYLSKAVSVHSISPYSHLSWQVGDWDLAPAIRLDHNSHFGSQFSPSFGVVYHIEGWKDGLIRSKASRVFNAPALLWVYNNDPVFNVKSNPDLKAERAYVYEVGVEGMMFLQEIKGQLNLYRSDVYDAIGWVNNAGIQKRNFSKFVRQGADSRIDYRLNNCLLFFVGAAFNDVRNVQTKKIVRDVGTARHNFKWGSHWASSIGTSVDVEGHYTRWGAPARTPANDRKPIFDIKLRQDFDKLHLQWDLEAFFNVYNITNSSYFADPYYPLPGRYVEGGLTLNF